MTQERWQKVKEVFTAASERAPAERAAFLDVACAGDPELRREVESLLACDAEPASLIDAPAVEAAAALLARTTAESVIGRHLGPYRIVQEIGRGGMGVVYLAERTDGEVRKQVAIKLIKRGMDTDAILLRFRHERQILSDLDHPHIVRFLDAGTTEDGLSYYIMDYVEGLPVDVYCDTNRLSVDERLKLFRTVCAAVHYAHERHVIHRDLKPSNILVTADGVVKLLDFGIAKVLDPEKSETDVLPIQHSLEASVSTTVLRPEESGTGILPVPHRLEASATTTGMALRLLTPEYASPEQVRGGPVTPASDLYSLGVLLYELLTGRPPYGFPSRALPEIERVICETEPEKPSAAVRRLAEVPSADETAPGTNKSILVRASRGETPDKLGHRLSGDLDNIVLMALRKEPERRYASVAEFSDDIRRHLEGRPVIARKDTMWYRGGKFLRRNRAVALASLLTALLLLALFGGWSYRNSRPARVAVKAQYSIAVLPFKVPDEKPEQQHLGLGMADTLIMKLNTLGQVIVRPTEEVRPYRKAQSDPLAPGRELGVDVLLDGTLARSGDRLAVNVELRRVSDGASLWATSFTAPFAEIFKAQDYILSQIIGVLGLQLTEAEKRRLELRHTDNPEAYDLLQTCWDPLLDSYYGGAAGGYRRSVACYEAVVAKDPNYALAYAGLARALQEATFDDQLSRAEAMPRAKAAAEKALALDETCARAHWALAAVLKVWEWDWRAAEIHYRRAVEVGPNDAGAHQAYGVYLVQVARFEEGIAEIRRALELIPRSSNEHEVLGWALINARRYDEALVPLQKALRLKPGFPKAHHSLGLAYLHQGRYREALSEINQAIQLASGNPNLSYLGTRGYLYAVSGKRAEAERVLAEIDEIARQQKSSGGHYARWPVYVGLGEKEKVWACLEAMYAEHVGLGDVRVNPLLDSLRSDPRFADLLRRMSLPP